MFRIKLFPWLPPIAAAQTPSAVLRPVAGAFLALAALLCSPAAPTVLAAEPQAASAAPAAPVFKPFVMGKPVRREGGGSRAGQAYTPFVMGKPVRREGGGSRGGAPLEANAPDGGGAFQPQVAGAPQRRESGGSRVPEALTPPRVALLAPEAAGVTVSPQPNLYWYLESDWPGMVRLVLDHEDDPDSLLDVFVYDSGLKAGVHRVSLRERGVTLAPGREYTWTVSLVMNPDDPSGDLVSRAAILRLPEPEGLAEALSKMPAHWAFAESGVWFDAVESLSLQIEASRDPAPLVAQRAALLGQVGLGWVAGGGAPPAP